MSLCLESSTVLASPATTSSNNIDEPQPTVLPSKSVAKLVLANPLSSSANNLQKVNSPLITVVNAPITVVKSLCSNSGVAAAPHFTIVGSTPLNVTNALGRSPTITLVNASPITVVKTVSNILQATENGEQKISNNSSIHNVFVKNSSEETDQKNAAQKPPNGQKPTAGGKVKILGKVVVPVTAPSTSGAPSNLLLNKTALTKFCPQTKILNNSTTKYVNRNLTKIGTPERRMLYPTHKNQMKVVQPLGNCIPRPGAVRNLSPQSRGMLGQVSNSGLRTIPPRVPKPSNKLNYIGKHAVQAQRLKHGNTKIKNMKALPPNRSYPNRMASQNTHMTINQALTAEILESLGPNPNANSSQSYANLVAESREETSLINSFDPHSDLKPLSELEALSLICQVVLLDHNYNATLPPESPTRNVSVTQPVLNGLSNSSMFSPGARSSLSYSNNSLMANNTSHMQDEDAASDISCGSERKPETEGEETDTAPEAEAVNNDEHYGDYVTRCICGFVHDDGYMIECDKCKVWQHVRCVVRTKKVPDDYLCEMCDPSKLMDRQKARSLQQQWMRESQDRDAKLRKEAKFREQKLKEVISDSDTSDDDHTGNNIMAKRRAGIAGRRKTDAGRTSTVRQRKELIKEVPLRRPLKRKEKKNKRKLKPPTKVQSEDENADWGNNTSQLPQLRQWIENYEEAVTNHYSPELRARISNIRINGAHTEINMNADAAVHKCRIQIQPLTGIKYLVSASSLPPDTPVLELRGKYMLSNQHRNATYAGPLTTRQHAQRPGPFLFFYSLHKDNTEVCVDTRTYGNDARFIRRSCKPNAELRHCIEKGVLHLYVVTVATVEKNIELTIKHETHDLAAVGTTHIACACVDPEDCAVNKAAKKNGENPVVALHRKRRGRRTLSLTIESEVKPKEEPPPPVEVPVIVEEPVKIEPVLIKPKEEPIKMEIESPPEVILTKIEQPIKKEDPETPVKKMLSPSKSESPESKKESEQNKKKTREERKMEAYIKAFERLEKQEQKKQEHQAKQAHRRESEPTPISREDDRIEIKIKRRRRKGRARTVSTNSQASRRNRLNSADSYVTSGDEIMLSPGSDASHGRPGLKDHMMCNSPEKAAGLLLALAGGENGSKSPTQDLDSNSNSAHSSPETPLSSACLLVAAAVEPLEPGFKFPKTKKGLMNEWLNKSPDCIQSASSISPSSLTPHVPTTTNESFFDGASVNYYPSKNLSQNYCDTPSQLHGNAKKRWLRQAISEDKCDSPNSRPDSPPITETVAPPKKRKLPRTSLSAEVSPPLTPTGINAPQIINDVKEEDQAPVMYNDTEGDNTEEGMDAEMVSKGSSDAQQDYNDCVQLPSHQGCNLDVCMNHDRGIFSNSDHLVGTVEKTLSFLGFEEQKVSTPAKRKLSITEYRQRKRLSKNCDELPECNSYLEDNMSSRMTMRLRSDSTSSTTSFISSDEETRLPEVTGKVLSSFNSEPTELEKQRENVSFRLKKAFGLAVEEDPAKTATFPIPGSVEVVAASSSEEFVEACLASEMQEKESGKPDLFYAVDEDKEKNETYVPPFNNPLYPNSNYGTYGSVIDDDTPYEGRNPSPPPEINRY